MNRKIKIILDILMLIILLTLFNSKLICMQYHEIAGLILAAIIAVHIGINIKTISAMCKKFVKVPAAVKAGVIVDFLLLICFLCLTVSGIFISRTILTGISSNNSLFRVSHMFAGGMSVILTGIHFGLHICRKPVPTVAAVIFSAFSLCLGVYGIINSNEIRLLTSPFTASLQSSKIGNPDSDDFKLHEFGQDGGEMDGSGSGRQNGKMDGSGSGRQKGKMDGSGQGQKNRFGVGGNGAGQHMSSLTLTDKLRTIFMFLGMMMSCSMLVFWIAVIGNRKKRAAA